MVAKTVFGGRMGRRRSARAIHIGCAVLAMYHSPILFAWLTASLASNSLRLNINAKPGLLPVFKHGRTCRAFPVSRKSPPSYIPSGPSPSAGLQVPAPAPPPLDAVLCPHSPLAPYNVHSCCLRCDAFSLSYDKVGYLGRTGRPWSRIGSYGSVMGRGDGVGSP